MSRFPTFVNGVASPKARSFDSVVAFTKRTSALSACFASAEAGADPFPSPLLETADCSATLSLLLEQAVVSISIPLSPATSTNLALFIPTKFSPPLYRTKATRNCYKYVKALLALFGSQEQYAVCKVKCTFCVDYLRKCLTSSFWT